MASPTRSLSYKNVIAKWCEFRKEEIRGDPGVVSGSTTAARWNDGCFFLQQGPPSGEKKGQNRSSDAADGGTKTEARSGPEGERKPSLAAIT
ncbi:unnamed protein product [Linum trigynum]|uniref:Uncharacterized protein n=1 Tax=Linum trigynum TaxID=586398 RepID=A0AAV2DUL9_9ROSI